MPPNNFNFGYQPQQRMQSNDVIAVPVNGEAGAQNYPVAAGNTVLLTDFNAGLIWLKSTDINGMFQNIRKFKVEEITPQPATPMSDFVPRSEFDQLRQSINQLIMKIGGNVNESSTNTASATSATTNAAGK